jgi:hypothetical protein
MHRRPFPRTSPAGRGFFRVGPRFFLLNQNLLHLVSARLLGTKNSGERAGTQAIFVHRSASPKEQGKQRPGSAPPPYPGFFPGQSTVLSTFGVPTSGQRDVALMRQGLVAAAQQNAGLRAGSPLGQRPWCATVSSSSGATTREGDDPHPSPLPARGERGSLSCTAVRHDGQRRLGNDARGSPSRHSSPLPARGRGVGGAMLCCARDASSRAGNGARADQGTVLARIKIKEWRSRGSPSPRVRGGLG